MGTSGMRRKRLLTGVGVILASRGRRGERATSDAGSSVNVLLSPGYLPECNVRMKGSLLGGKTKGQERALNLPGQLAEGRGLEAHPENTGPFDRGKGAEAAHVRRKRRHRCRSTRLRREVHRDKRADVSGLHHRSLDKQSVLWEGWQSPPRLGCRRGTFSRAA